MYDLDEFIRLLTSNQKILDGGDSYEDWASDVLDLCLKHRNVVASGGLLVPQLGKDAGFSKSFERAANRFDIDIKELHSILEKFWVGKPLEDKCIFLKETDPNNKLSCVFSPVSYGFDRPIGYFWVLVSEESCVEVEKVIIFASILVSLCVRAEKSCYAISLLSKPVWEKIDTAISASKYAANMCLEALSCRAVVVWRLNKNENILNTIVSVGKNCENLKVDMDCRRGKAGLCASNNETIVVDDLLKETKIEHPSVVKSKKLRSGIFIPLDTGGEVVGVMGVYGARPNAFSELDVNISSSFAQWLVTRLVQQTRIEETNNMRNKIDKEMPLIESGILAMERVHDAGNKLAFAQNDLSMITDRHRKININSNTYIDAISASKHIDDVKNIISALVNRSKLTKQYFKKCNIADIIQRVIKSVENQAEENRVNIIFDPDQETQILCDKKLIERLFQNLFDNSLLFLERVPGKRTIIIKIIEQDASVTISFRDNGIGIPDYELSKIFDVFHTTKGDRGLGFGLAIVKRIVDDHNGKITPFSVWGEFTEFKIEMPLYKK